MKRFSFKACSVLLCLAMMLTVIFIAPVSAEETTVIGYSDTLVGDAFRYGGQGKTNPVAVNVNALKDIKDYDGSWPSNNSYKVTNVEGLVMLSNLVNSGKDNFFGINFYLASNIDFAAEENVEWAKKFIPIGYNCGYPVIKDGITYSAQSMFQGTFDGRGYTIKNMNLEFANKTEVTATYMDKTNVFYVCQVGLFGMINNQADKWASEIRNVKMENCTINSAATTSPSSEKYPNGQVGWGSSALLVGRSQGGLVIKNCSVSGSVKVTVNAQGAGISGRGNAAVENCTNYANISANNRHGGIVGWDATSIINCVNYGVIGNGGNQAGSIAGQVADTTPITNCQNYGYAHKNGKLAGLVDKGGAITDCYEAGLKRMLEKTKFQINEDGTGVRMLAGLDSLNYESVTFMVTYNDQTVELTTKSAYSSVAGTDAEGNPITYAPNAVGDTAAAKYIAAYDLLNVPAGATFTFVVKVVTADGITLTSTFAKTVEVPAAQ